MPSVGSRVHVDTLGCEAAAHRVLTDRARLQELQQVVRPAGLVADAAELEATERMAADDRARRLAVNVQVAGAKGGPARGDVARVARVQTAGEREVGVHRYLDGLVEAPGVKDAEDRAENLFARQWIVALH